MICMLELKPQVEYFRYLDYGTVHNAFFKFWLIALFNAPSKLKCRKCSWCINHAQWSANFISYYWEREKTVDYSCCGLWWQWWLLALLCASTDMLEVLVEGTWQMWSFRVRKSHHELSVCMLEMLKLKLNADILRVCNLYTTNAASLNVILDCSS